MKLEEFISEILIQIINSIIEVQEYATTKGAVAVIALPDYPESSTQ